MSHYVRLKKSVRHTSHLIIDGATDEVRLVDEETTFHMMNETGLFRSQVVMNASRALENFAQLSGKDDRNFTLREITAMTGQPYSQVYGWLLEKVIWPSVRPPSGSGRGKESLFSWGDAFAAGVVGSLRRNGVGLPLLKQVQPLFNKTKKRTARKLTTSGRS